MGRSEIRANLWLWHRFGDKLIHIILYDLSEHSALVCDFSLVSSYSLEKTERSVNVGILWAEILTIQWAGKTSKNLQNVCNVSFLMIYLAVFPSYRSETVNFEIKLVEFK